MANVKGSYGRFGLVPGNNTVIHGRLLLAQRGYYPDQATKEKKWDGRMNLPGGGVDEEDAAASCTPEDIVAREVKEETGLDIIFADHRPVGEYPTAKHTDVAITYLCKEVGGQLLPKDEGVSFMYVSPSEAMELARKGDVPGGLVGGIKTSTGGVPRHIQMILHFFTRVGQDEQYREEAKRYCKELGIPE